MNRALRLSVRGKNECLLVITAAFLIASFTVILEVPLLFFFVLLIWSGMVVFALQDLKNRAAYLIFLIALFMFLIGGEFTELYMGHPQEFVFSRELDTHAYICLIISLCFLQAGFCMEVQNRRNRVKRVINNDVPQLNVIRVRKVSQTGLFVTVVPYYLKTLDAGLYTLQNGYLKYYTEYKSRLPGMVEMLSELFTMFFFIYLATMPSKKNCRLPMLLYLGNGILALITGRRIFLGVCILVLGAYIIIRNKISPEEGWINRRKIIAAFILCPVLIAGLYMQRYIRYGEAIEENHILDIIFRFFSQQGASINVIKLQKELEGDELGCTSLYYTLYYLRANVITRHFIDFPLEYYAKRTASTAFSTNCLADYIMYKVNSADYYAGYGLGTSYIAELNHDFGYLGIALGSMAYGRLLKWLYSMKHFSFWRFVAGLMMLEEFVIMPRYGADVIFRPFFNLTKMMAFSLIIIAASPKCLKRVSENCEEKGDVNHV